MIFKYIARISYNFPKYTEQKDFEHLKETCRFFNSLPHHIMEQTCLIFNKEFFPLK